MNGGCHATHLIRGEFGPYRFWEICHDGHLLMDRIMKSQHVDPEEAVQIHMDIQVKTSLAIHCGMCALAYELWSGSPVVVLHQASLLRLRIHDSLRESLGWKSM